MDKRKKRLDISLALKSKIDENSIGYVRSDVEWKICPKNSIGDLKNHVEWKKEPGKLYFRFPSPFILSLLQIKA